ncbi:MAG TPA: hypothetical protein PLU80_13230, partial [Acidobacteriota bacterium]|nr:hypothetical protein [Acidobacteriota bacterium]
LQATIQCNPRQYTEPFRGAIALSMAMGIEIQPVSQTGNLVAAQVKWAASTVFPSAPILPVKKMTG